MPCFSAICKNVWEMLLKPIFLSVFDPSRILRSTIEKRRIGLVLILVRWSYYAVIFTFFRDYRTTWAPFIKAPFGLPLESYAFWQGRLAIPFGVSLMTALALGLYGLMKTSNKHPPPVWTVLNILGFAYFLPFVVVQFIDLIVKSLCGWDPWAIVPLHTAVLVWEAVAAVALIHRILPLGRVEKILGTALQVGIWILVCAVLWR